MTRVVRVTKHTCDHQPFLDCAESCGYEGFVFKNGADALKFIRDDGPVDLLISDTDMKDMSGQELSGWMKRLYPRIPVVLMTGEYPSELEEQTGRPCLTSPFNTQDIFERYLPRNKR